MKYISKSKSFISAILLAVIMFTSLPLYAASHDIISNVEHKQTIENFITQIKAVQTQISEIAQSILNNPNPQDTRQLKLRINSINTDIEKLYVTMQDYFATVPGVNERNRHIFLTFNVLNLTKSNLYTLNTILNATTDQERLALSAEYSTTLAASLDALEIIESILSRFGT